MEPLITITLNDYDKLQKQISELKKESVRDFINKEFRNIQENDYDVYIDGHKLVRFIKENYQENGAVYMKDTNI